MMQMNDLRKDIPCYLQINLLLIDQSNVIEPRTGVGALI